MLSCRSIYHHHSVFTIHGWMDGRMETWKQESKGTKEKSLILISACGSDGRSSFLNPIFCSSPTVIHSRIYLRIPLIEIDADSSCLLCKLIW